MLLLIFTDFWLLVKRCISFPKNTDSFTITIIKESPLVKIVKKSLINKSLVIDVSFSFMFFA